MRELCIAGVSRRPSSTRTTIPERRRPPAPDRLIRRFCADRPDRVWVADITYIPTYESWLLIHHRIGRLVARIRPFGRVVGVACHQASAKRRSSRRAGRGACQHGEQEE
jgi:hypothetical protein